MRFIVDAQLPPALARALSDVGHNAEHVTDFGLHEADDSSTRDCALEEKAAIITKDEDFSHRLRQNPQKAPTIIWLRIGNTTRRNLLRLVQNVLPKLDALIQSGEKLIEVRL